MSVNLRWSRVGCYGVCYFIWGSLRQWGGRSLTCSEYSDIFTDKRVADQQIKSHQKYMYTILVRLSFESKLTYPLQLTAIPPLKKPPIITSLCAGGSPLNTHILHQEPLWRTEWSSTSSPSAERLSIYPPKKQLFTLLPASLPSCVGGGKGRVIIG